MPDQDVPAAAEIERLVERLTAITAETTKLLDFIDNEGPCAMEWEAITATAEKLRSLIA